MTTDAQGTKIGEQGNYPFGEFWYSSSATTKWRFTSYERDAESGNDYAIFRYHSNRLGRFLTPDPLARSVASPQSLNRYSYVLNNPVNFIDPLGLACYPIPGGIHCDVGHPIDLSFGQEGSEGEWKTVPVSSLRESIDYTVGNLGFELARILGGAGPHMLSGLGPPDHISHGGTGTTGGEPDPAGGTSAKEKIATIVNTALKEANLPDCLNEFFGPGTILTNENLPYIDASRNLSGAGEMRSTEVPGSGRGTVYIDNGMFRSLSGSDPQLVGTYLHELANVLAVQQFTNELDPNNRPLLGPRGGPPTKEQADSWDQDIGQLFEKCIFGKK
jgi:RHS repeat-associated protein